MTRPHRLLTSFLLVVGLTACPGSPAPEAPRGAPLTELPSPVVGGGAPDSVRPAADPTDWRLPEEGLDAVPWLRLLLVQDNRGEMEACGCPGAPTGGLARRATLGEALRGLLPGAVVVEGPNSLGRAIVGIEAIRGEHRARGRQVVKLLHAWQPRAFFPGQADLAVVPLAELQGLARFPIVVSNLADPGAHGTLPSLEIDVQGRRVLMLGLVRPAVSEAARTRLPLRPVPQAVAELVAAAGPLDAVVAFTDASLRDLTSWFAAGLDVDILVAPPGPGQEGESQWKGRTLVVRSQPAGRSVQRLDLVFHGGEGRGLWASSPHEGALGQIARQEEQYLFQRRLREGLLAEEQAGRDPREFVRTAGGETVLSPRTDPDAVQRGLAELKALRRGLVTGMGAPGQTGHSARAIKMTVRAELEEDVDVVAALDAFGARRLAEIEESVAASAPDSRYLGHEACVDCHTSAQGHWARTAHARAWATLVERGEQRNPECLACHSTGFGAAGGFADPDKARHLVGVQCEACHGPMELHAGQARTPGYKSDPGQPVAEATCLGCHDPVNSPRFDYDSYTAQVEHPGRRRSP